MTPAELSKIEKQILIRAPRERVWRALTNVEEFSKWFGCETVGVFAPGARVEMVVIHQGRTIPFHVIVEKVEPGRLLSWRWHPGMPRPEVDYSTESPTLVEFFLEDAEHGTLLTVVESGFDRISLARRAGVFAENDRGWEFQTKSIERYVRESA
jgi:uncharacterized protein YndB with AHSA1/START domain